MAGTPELAPSSFDQLAETFRKIEEEARRVLRNRYLTDMEILQIADALKRQRREIENLDSQEDLSHRHDLGLQSLQLGDDPAAAGRA